MKSRDIQELKNKAVTELEKMLRDSRDSLRALKFDLVAGKVKNVSAIRELRKDIARLMTFTQKENHGTEK